MDHDLLIGIGVYVLIAIALIFFALNWIKRMNMEYEWHEDACDGCDDSKDQYRDRCIYCSYEDIH